MVFGTGSGVPPRDDAQKSQAQCEQGERREHEPEHVRTGHRQFSGTGGKSTATSGNSAAASSNCTATSGNSAAASSNCTATSGNSAGASNDSAGAGNKPTGAGGESGGHGN
ncbi:hypothetical protein [Micrococcus sp. TA1]|uniref:hypothetical protein n=1 Tax=Micrococcus sp. TA1 TaxID=681627 RepID=UPI00160F3FC3|nr:hypothetical protein [Micrococcus sp. TA1]MBB5749933.1 hypothetical protein [Micrococcus sp. TA1]